MKDKRNTNQKKKPSKKKTSSAKSKELEDLKQNLADKKIEVGIEYTEYIAEKQKNESENESVTWAFDLNKNEDRVWKNWINEV